jgi:hypothetical protein
MKEGQTYKTQRGTLVRIISLERVACTKNWITVKDIENGFSFYISPDSLIPIE